MHSKHEKKTKKPSVIPTPIPQCSLGQACTIISTCQLAGALHHALPRQCPLITSRDILIQTYTLSLLCSPNPLGYGISIILLASLVTSDNVQTYLLSSMMTQ